MKFAEKWIIQSDLKIINAHSEGLKKKYFSRNEKHFNHWQMVRDGAAWLCSSSDHHDTTNQSPTQELAHQM